MKGRVVARVALTLLVFAVVGIAPPRTATLFAADSAEFILCARDDRAAAVAARHNLTIIRSIDEHSHGVFLVRGPVTLADNSAPSLIDELRSDPDVEHFDANLSALVTEKPGGPRLSESTVAILDSLNNPVITNYFGADVWDQYVDQAATRVVRLPEAQPLSTGSGVTVAVIDTGVDPSHPGLASVLVPGYDFTRNVEGSASEWPDLDESTVAILDSAHGSILDQGNAPVSVNESTVAILDSATASEIDPTQIPKAFGHGTMVAGLVHLIAPSARIMPLKAFRADGSSTLFDIERAIYYAVDHGAKVINMSFNTETAAAELTHAISYASAHGALSLASVGNSGKPDVVFPAAFRNVMAVASTTLTDQRSSFSNYGDHLVTLAAPGESLITFYPGGRYASVSGTSFSTAVVSGGAALLAQLEPTVDQRLALRYFEDGAVMTPDAELGNGRIDLFASIRGHAMAPAPPIPTGDKTAPSVALLSPAAGATVTGLAQLVANATDDVGVAALQFFVDGQPIGDGSAVISELKWNSVSVPNGAHTFSVAARDAAGNQQTSKPIVATVLNDTAPPVVAMTTPIADSAVSGTIALIASASDDVGVVGVQFLVDGVSIGQEILAAPFQRAWNSADVANGSHLLAVTARDAAGHREMSKPVAITVVNPALP